MPVQAASLAAMPAAADILGSCIHGYLGSKDPVPAEDAAHEIGDGDFRAIGAEFLRHFVEIGGLSPRDDVLDVGCGFGRMALPLARYLDPTARYLGLDIVAEPVAWCRRHVAPLHPGFAFEHADIRDPLYNPAGALPADSGFLGSVPAPLGWRPDFIAMDSVLTHLERPAIDRLLTDARSVLRPGGHLLLTAFLTGEGTPPPGTACCFPPAAWRLDRPLTGLRGEPTTAAVGISWQWLTEAMGKAGLRPERVSFGHWRRGHEEGTAFQDLVVAC